MAYQPRILGVVAPLSPVSDLVVHEEGDEAFILHMGTGVYFSLNASGLVAWRAMAAGDDPLAALVRAYPDVPAERLERDWDAVSKELETQGLVASA